MQRTLRQHRLSPIAISLALAAAGSVLLLRFPPERYGFYPRCPVYEIFGVLCPGCGGTRALAALLRGHFAEAAGWNALVTVAALLAVPAVAGYAAARKRWPALISRTRLNRWRHPLAGAGLVATVLFTLWRNLR